MYEPNKELEDLSGIIIDDNHFPDGKNQDHHYYRKEILYKIEVLTNIRRLRPS